ncbi:hypothetical protein D3C72_1794950 [compost metagenome]
MRPVVDLNNSEIPAPNDVQRLGEIEAGHIGGQAEQPYALPLLLVGEPREAAADNGDVMTDRKPSGRLPNANFHRPAARKRKAARRDHANLHSSPSIPLRMPVLLHDMPPVRQRIPNFRAPEASTQCQSGLCRIAYLGE